MADAVVTTYVAGPMLDLMVGAGTLGIGVLTAVFNCCGTTPSAND